MAIEITPEHLADLLTFGAPEEARRAVLAPLEAGIPVREIYLDLLAPALYEVGRRWEHGRATVAQEHVATAIVRSIMAGLADRAPHASSRRRRIVLACTEGELHDTGLRMVGDFLEGDGWEVVYVGPATPAPALAELVERVRPDVVGLSTAIAAHLPAARDALAVLRALPAPPYLVVGGAAYLGDEAGAAASVGADAYARDAAAASDLLSVDRPGQAPWPSDGGASAGA
jgi:methanogenic corrinoid protein MtbC1